MPTFDTGAGGVHVSHSECITKFILQICWLCETMKYRLESAVRGYDVYQIIWDTVVGETLPCVTESSNSTVSSDRFAVVFMRNGVVLEHFLLHVLYF